MDRNNDKLDLVIHAHFYQPPRQDPVNGIIAFEKSAAPYSNWNEKIYHCCYASNSESRFLNQYGRIQKIINNYNNISFDFGPTLLSWLEDNHKNTFNKIIDADKEALERLGHGNAIAHAFNHTILPLDSKPDSRVQIAWGIEAFEHFFGRKPEGMWLAECAINESVIEDLADEGIKFVILSAAQIEEIMTLSGESANLPFIYDRPFVLEGMGGKKITAFLSSDEMAHQISFNHILRNADAVYSKLLEIKGRDNPMYISTATDGEIYGYHESFADMALSALSEKIKQRNDFALTNYGVLYEKYKPSYKAKLKITENEGDISWSSISNNTERWRKENQSEDKDEIILTWRHYLRDSLNRLNKQIDDIFKKEVSRILNKDVDTESLMRLAGTAFMGFTNMEDFLHSLHQRYDFDRKNDSEMAQLFNAKRNIMYSFTSCTFNYSDVSSIESRHAIRFALYAMRLSQKFYIGDIMLPFLSDLRRAIGQDGKSAMEIAQEELIGLSGESEASLAFYLNILLSAESDRIDRYGKYHLMKNWKEGEVFYLDIKDETNLRLYHFSIYSSSNIERGLNLFIGKKSDDENVMRKLHIENRDIPQRLAEQCFAWIDNMMNTSYYSQIETMSQSMYHYSLLFREGLEKSPQTIENLGLAIKIVKSMLNPERDDILDERTCARINLVLAFVFRSGREYERDCIKRLFNIFIDSIAKKIEVNLREDYALKILSCLRLSRSHSFEPELFNIQNVLYPYYTGEKKAGIDSHLLDRLLKYLNFE